MLFTDPASRRGVAGRPAEGGAAHPRGERAESAGRDARGGRQGAAHGRRPLQPARV